MDIKDYVTLERTFLHDIATPLMIASGQAEYINKKFDTLNKEQILAGLEKIVRATQKLTSQLEEHREKIKCINLD